MNNVLVFLFNVFFDHFTQFNIRINDDNGLFGDGKGSFQRYGDGKGDYGLTTGGYGTYGMPSPFFGDVKPDAVRMGGIHHNGLGANSFGGSNSRSPTP